MSNSQKSIDLLKGIPDFVSWNKALVWLQDSQEKVQNWHVREDEAIEVASLDWSQIALEPRHPFGLYSFKKWRQFVLATFLADLASYKQSIDQVNFERLLFVMHQFPQGFRTWWVKAQNDIWLPVGYTGWYPMLETMFDLFDTHPEKLIDRTVIPAKIMQNEKNYLYLFNFSTIPQLKKSQLSKALMKAFIDDITAQKADGIACITVSEDGIRIANRLDMICTGSLVIDGCSENVYTQRG